MFDVEVASWIGLLLCAGTYANVTASGYPLSPAAVVERGQRLLIERTSILPNPKPVQSAILSFLPGKLRENNSDAIVGVVPIAVGAIVVVAGLSAMRWCGGTVGPLHLMLQVCLKMLLVSSTTCGLYWLVVHRHRRIRVNVPKIIADKVTVGSRLAQQQQTPPSVLGVEHTTRVDFNKF